MFFTYRQNNSGGSWSFSKDKVTQYVIIEADTTREANILAKAVGIYFNGVEDYLDCDCCGDRWSKAWDDGDKVPSIYGTPVEVWASTKERYHSNWMDENPDVYVHYLDGRVESHKKKLD